MAYASSSFWHEAATCTLFISRCLKKDAELTDAKKRQSAAETKLASLQARFTELQAEHKAMEFERTVSSSVHIYSV